MTANEQEQEQGTPRRSLRRTVVSGLLVLALVGAFGWALAGRWDEVVVALREQNPLVLLASLALCLLAVLMSFLLWRGTMATLGSHVPARRVARMFFVAQLGKYVPGSVWPVVAQMRMGREIGLPRARVGLAFLLTLGLSVLWGLVAGLAALPALVAERGPGFAVVLLALPLVLTLLVPQVINKLLARALTLLRRPPLEQPLPGRAIFRGSLWTLAFWVVFGLHVWVLAVGLGADPLRTLPVAIGGFALAFSIGPLLVVLPAGAGVREAVLVVLLSTVLPPAEATAVALTSRGLLMATDGLLAAAGAAVPHRHRAPQDVPSS
ncbi:MAG: lysylphosphatidylglycerol synthase domain-containing protein [Actinomycetes bacterium]